MNILIRRSNVSDQAALERLAALDSRELPEGSCLMAEVGGELVAAASLDVEAEPLADPSRSTADICELLELWASYVRRDRAARDRRAARAHRALRDVA